MKNLLVVMALVGAPALATNVKADKIAKQIRMLRLDIKETVETIQTLEALDTVYAQQLFEANQSKACIKKTKSCPAETYEEHRRNLQYEISDAYELMRKQSADLDKLLNFLLMN